MQNVTSADGTSIAYKRRGEGPPVVLLHGSSATHHAWEAVVSHLSDDFTVIVPDRRGRGESGDAEEYSLDREVEDLQAVLDTTDGDATVFGHSFGGLVALATAAESDVERLVLYEPSLLINEYRGENLAAQMQEKLDAEELKGAMKLFFRKGGGVPAPEQLPIWPEKVRFELVDTVVRGNKAVESFQLSAQPNIECPMLLLTGEQGPEHLRAGVQTIADRVPQSTLVEFDGVGHIGTQSAPRRVADAVRSFCLDQPVQSYRIPRLYPIPW